MCTEHCKQPQLGDPSHAMDYVEVLLDVVARVRSADVPFWDFSMRI